MNAMMKILEGNVKHKFKTVIIVNSIHHHLFKSLLGQQEVTEDVSVLGDSSGENFLPLLVLRQVHVALHTTIFRRKLLDDAYGRLRLKKESKLNK